MYMKNVWCFEQLGIHQLKHVAINVIVIQIIQYNSMSSGRINLLILPLAQISFLFV